MSESRRPDLQLQFRQFNSPYPDLSILCHTFKLAVVITNLMEAVVYSRFQLRACQRHPMSESKTPEQTKAAACISKSAIMTIVLSFCSCLWYWSLLDRNQLPRCLYPYLLPVKVWWAGPAQIQALGSPEDWDPWGDRMYPMWSTYSQLEQSAQISLLTMHFEFA